MSSTQASEGAIELALLTSTSFVSSRGKPDISTVPQDSVTKINTHQRHHNTISAMVRVNKECLQRWPVRYTYLWTILLIS